MVRNIPGTRFEASQDGMKAIFERAQAQFGCCFILMMILAGPVAIGLVLFGITLAVASLVFGIQALVVGSATYQAAPCQYTLGVWLIVYGSLVVGNCGLNCLFGGSRRAVKDENKDEKQGGPPGPIFAIMNLIPLAIFGWLCYGVNLVYNPGTLRECNSSQFGVFEMIVMFMFWGTIAILGALLFLCCGAFPILYVLKEDIAANVDKNMEAERQAEVKRNADADAKKQADDLEKGLVQQAVQANVNINVLVVEAKTNTSNTNEAREIAVV